MVLESARAEPRRRRPGARCDALWRDCPAASASTASSVAGSKRDKVPSPPFVTQTSCGPAAMPRRVAADSDECRHRDRHGGRSSRWCRPRGSPPRPRRRPPPRAAGRRRRRSPSGPGPSGGRARPPCPTAERRSRRARSRPRPPTPRRPRECPSRPAAARRVDARDRPVGRVRDPDRALAERDAGRAVADPDRLPTAWFDCRVDPRDGAVEPVGDPDGVRRLTATPAGPAADRDRLPDLVRLTGSMRETVFSPVFVTQIASGPPATPPGATPTGYLRRDLAARPDRPRRPRSRLPRRSAADPPPWVRSTPTVDSDDRRGEGRADRAPGARAAASALAISSAAASASSPSRPSNGAGAAVFSSGKSC